MANIYENSQGQIFNTQAEAAASNTALGTNPSVNNINTGSIPVSSLTSTPTPVNLPSPYTPNFGGVQSSINSLIENTKKQNEGLKSLTSSSLNEYLQEVLASGNISSSVDRTFQDESKKKYDKFTSDLEQEQLNTRRQIEKLQKENPQGLFGGGLSQEVNRIERDSLSKQADIAILQSAAARDYQTASEIADRQVQMKTEQSKSRVEALKYFYEQNKADFTKNEDRIYDQEVKKAERELNKQETLENDLKSIKLEAAKNGAPLSVITALGNAKSLNEALKSVGSYLTSPKEKLELQKLRGDINKQALELASAKQTLGGSTGDAVQDIILGSSKYGDKNLVGAQLEQVQKAVTALGSMESLQALLTQGKDGVKGTGPLTGRARNLVSQLGGDADARAINATIQGLIPTVARGIFGEVGVLTDADIANYRKTVPNITSTDAQNKLVSIIMYDVLSRSLASTLTTNAMNQTNVSNFSSLYTDARNRISALKADLGVVETTPISPLNKAKLDSAWGNYFSPQNITNSLNSLLDN